MNNHPVSWQPGSRTRTRQAMSPSHVATGRASIADIPKPCVRVCGSAPHSCSSRSRTGRDGSTTRIGTTTAENTLLDNQLEKDEKWSGVQLAECVCFPPVLVYLSVCLLRLATNRHRHRHRHHHRHRHRHRHPSREMSYTGTHIRALHIARKSYSTPVYSTQLFLFLSYVPPANTNHTTFPDEI